MKSPRRVTLRISVPLFALALALQACAAPDGRAGNEPRSPSPSSSQEQEVVLFDGVIHGWRIAPSSVLSDEGVPRGTEGDPCSIRETGAEIETDLDFGFTYLPKGAGDIQGPQVYKEVCGKEHAFSVAMSYYLTDSPIEGAATITATRALYGVRAYQLDAPRDQVEPCEVSGRPAICAHYADDELARGLGGYILVIEDDTMDPYATILLVSTSGLPFSELMKIAEGVK